ncbi:MAG: dipicolinate synthase subunit B [Ignavibacteriales bacterium]
MLLEGKRLGVCVTGSFHNIPRVLQEFKRLVDEGASLVPVVSSCVATVDTRFGTAKEVLERIEECAGKRPLVSVAEVEPFGPKKIVDLTIVAPCTGNTLAKIAAGVSDGPVTMAVKSTLRNSRPVVLCVASNDLLGLNARNLGALLSSRNVYFVPFGQDNPFEKPTSVESDAGLIVDTVVGALQGKQIQPLLIQRHKA